MNFHVNRGNPEEVTPYFKWLLDKVNVYSGGTIGPEYTLLLQQLHKTRFTYTLSHDENRAMDGLELRHEYENADISDGQIMTGRCTVLEMLVALAIRIDRDVVDNGAEWWFGQFIRNLWLDEYDDEHYNSDSIAYRLDVWLKRQYDSNGSGGLFPLMMPTEDQRKKELWSQMQQYVSENFSLTA